MEKELSKQDWQLILESLKYTKLKFENYDKYPSIKYKQKKVEAVALLIKKIKSIIN